MFILGIITIVCFVGYWLYQCMGCGNGSAGGLQADINKQLGKIEGQQQQISNEITRAGAASQSAQDSIQRAQLTEVKQQLSKSQESLIISREQLKSAELLQKQMQDSLSLLEKQITIEREQEARTQKRLRRQRNIAYAFFGITIIGYIKKL